MDTFAAMALASLPPSYDVLNEKPRSTDAFIINSQMKWGICLLGGVFFLFTFALLYYFERIHGIDRWELTVFFSIFVMLQWWNLFNAKALGSNHSAFHNLHLSTGFLFVLLLVLVGQWLIVTFGGEMFRTMPLSAETWLYIILGTSPVMLVGEMYRMLRRIF
jgi:Ca2+-transporting ATPase